MCLRKRLYAWIRLGIGLALNDVPDVEIQRVKIWRAKTPRTRAGGALQWLPQGLKIIPSAYIEKLDKVINPCIKWMAYEKPYVLKQDSAPSPTTYATQERLAETFHRHMTPNMWLPIFPNLKPLNYYVKDVVEKETNKQQHNTKEEGCHCGCYRLHE
ncbi:hypothetical protein CDAR_200421 [Caerostris darwini]|uniref:Uncharacterized protein n=1 Tax=Caerostris darwini TaxID=1538125 RepID=A0AAV4RAE9_9ARAC|nr:hypothetical protein CDAR_200421 [Caerostris darwini]